MLIRLLIEGLKTINDANIILEIILALEPILALDKLYNLS